VKIDIEVDSVKMLREALCLAEQAMHETGVNIAASQKRRIAGLIRELDRHRPLGIDGRHGDLHTRTCGCGGRGSVIIEARPVIVIHLEDPPGSRLAACCGEPFAPDQGTTHLDIPRTGCTGCTLGMNRRKQ
jgi:hypothetical protein